MRHVIVRCQAASSFFGVFVSRKGREVVLKDARRLWHWKGAASLSQLAVSGTSDPGSCKFPASVKRVELLDAIEVMDMTPAAIKSLSGVPVWKM